jgi:hypothetical protein
MRLLHATTLEFHEFFSSQVPAYTILSHRWEDGEVSHQDMISDFFNAEDKPGFAKIQQCCLQALEEDLSYVWVDTCCIDKLSSAELSEAINSMYRWYRNSAMCYVYLSDVQHTSPNESTAKRLGLLDSVFDDDQFLTSKWWNRGWTLQGLVAPDVVKFFVNNGKSGWTAIGSKNSLLDLILYNTSIERDVLQGMDVGRCSVAKRMSWASNRKTTRMEDTAYCLLGIFEVNMPLLYGEGERAFLRLQV